MGFLGWFLTFLGGKRVSDRKVLYDKVVELVELHLETMLRMLESSHKRIRPRITLSFANFDRFFVVFWVFDEEGRV